MGFLLEIFRWIYGLLRKALSIICDLPAQIAVAIGSVVAAVGTMFGNFTWLDGAVQWVNSATYVVEGFVNSTHSDLFEIFFGWFAVDTFVQVCGVVVSATFGVAVVVFVTIFSAVFGLVPVVLGVRAICKALQTVSVGYVKP